MSDNLPDLPETEGEFLHVCPGQIKIQQGMLGRQKLGDLTSLKQAIVWRERRKKGEGLLQPLLVSRLPFTSYYRLEDGLRRLCAVRQLLAEGVEIPTVPVRVLPNALSDLERLILLCSDGKPLEALEQAQIIDRMQKEGLSLDNLAHVFGASADDLARRKALLRLSDGLKSAIEHQKIAPDLVEGFWKRSGGAGEVSDQALKAAEEYFATADPAKESPLAPERSQSSLSRGPAHKTDAWAKPVFDPTYQYSGLLGLYQWMGGSQAHKQGYSTKVVGIIELMLHYCGGELSLTETAQALKKIK